MKWLGIVAQVLNGVLSFVKSALPIYREVKKEVDNFEKKEVNK